MPCQIVEERYIPDRKSFLLQSLFMDVLVFKAISTLQHLRDNNQSLFSGSSYSHVTILPLCTFVPE